SKGKLGYVHVKGMNRDSFKKVYSDILGRYNDKDGIVVDTRFNGGGWLHNDLAVLLSGKKYASFFHRDIKNLGGEPLSQWSGDSVLVVNEGNYSDAHLFAYTYRALEIGKIVGMPVAGTSTAVWWPRMLDRTMYYGVPQIGINDMDENILENRELVPDFVVENSPHDYIEGRDRQLEKAVEVLTVQIDEKTEVNK
ncbi:MAG: S41 family peptidase, partial [bacterium]